MESVEVGAWKKKRILGLSRIMEYGVVWKTHEEEGRHDEWIRLDLGVLKLKERIFQERNILGCNHY
ncbi:hypothetical protein KI387_026987, partial [Taxus chinensis]